MVSTSVSPDDRDTPRDAAAVLAATAELGGYFAVASGGAGEGAHLADLIRDPTTAVTFVDRTRLAIATSMGCDPDRIPVRMAASSFQLNVVSRLISPVIGSAVLGSAVPLFTAESVRWRAADDHSPRFHTAGVQCVPAPTLARAAALVSASLLATIVGPLNDTLSSAVSLSGRVSWGNAISAANGAVTVMGMARPELVQRGRALVQALLDLDQLRGSGLFNGNQFVRRSCCLFYQAPMGGLCGDCVLAVSDGSQQTRVH
ncbi:(2Fe-2S)-binding protein [Mycobacterium sp. NPDC006124]|uniref:(2Fe-2S)-binding protein n=1 Tax=Mycobacterium sp. NPDC006124 TaxID=3156729 RepID=UPI0033B761E1